MPRRNGFTLLEMLVVVAIIGLLVGITMPSISEARRLAKKTVCKKNLGQIGTALHAYLVSNKDYFPTLCRLPSYEPQLARQEGRKPYPSMMVGLARELSGGTSAVSPPADGQDPSTGPVHEVFRCPADRNTKSPEIASDRYFDREGTSYEWESQLNGLRLDFRGVRILAKTRLIKPQDTWVVFDFEAFHGGDHVRGSHNVLYADLRVQSDNWRSNKAVGRPLPE